MLYLSTLLDNFGKSADPYVMNIQTLRALAKVRDKRASDIARMAGVSRQAVSKWMKAGAHAAISVRSQNLQHLADGLGIRADELLRSLPVLDDHALRSAYETIFLWDRLYPGLEDFAIALVRGNEAALARLVQVFGLYKSANVAGPQVWRRFPFYKKHIRPIRREQLERLWKLRQERTSR